MTEKAVLAATDVYEQLLVEYGDEPSQPWSKVRAAMKADNATADLVEFLPKDLGRAVRSQRKGRLVKGRPRNRPARSGVKP